MSNTRRGGSTRAWRVKREAVLLRDGHLCQIQTPGVWLTRNGYRQCLIVATEAHHIHGWSRCAACKADEIQHLQAACRPCNLKVGEPKQPKPKGVSSTQWW